MVLDLRWLGCDLVTGRVIEELSELTPKAPIAHLLATYTSCQFTLPIPLGGHGSAPLGWQAATEERRTMIVATLADQPIWAGAVLVNRVGTKPEADISVVSLEGYLDRRYVGDHTWVGQDEASVIMAGLFGDANTTEGIGLVLDCPATGTLRDQTYKDSDDKTVYSALRSEMGAINGPEWTIALDWTDSTRTAVKKIARVRKRIGVATSTPAAVFDSVGSSSAVYEQVRDYSSGKGANHIVAVSSGQGDSRPQSTPARDETALASGVPRWEHRFTPSTSITDVAVLDAHAQRALELMANGARTVSLTARADAYPLLGTDWTTGDDIGYALSGHGHPDVDGVPGLAGTARAIGWSLDTKAETITPILLMPGGEVV